MKIIYKITLPEPDSRIYFGSCKSFKAMLLQHKSPCSNPNDVHYDSALYTAIRKVGTWEDCKVVKITDICEGYVRRLLKDLIRIYKTTDPAIGLNYKREK